MEKGFVKLHRSILDWEWWSDQNTFRLFIYLLIKANSSDKIWRGTKIERGSLLTSRASLSTDTGLTEQQIRTTIKHLLSTNEITIKSTNKLTKITITNYDKYQQSMLINQPTEQPTKAQENNQESTSKITNNQPVNQPVNNHSEEYIEEKNNIEKKEDTKVSSKKEKVFVKPTVEEVREYCLQRGNHLDAEKFWNYYESIGWLVGNKKMKDWKAAVRTWERKDADVNRESYQLSANWDERTYVERKNDYWQ